MDLSAVMPEPSGVYDCGDGAVLYIYENMSADDLSEYKDSFLKKGFSLFNKNSVNDTVFYTLTDGKSVLHMYTGIDGEIRIIDEPNTNLPNKEKCSCKRKNPTELFQFETDHSLIDCGMCYIIRCADGSFFIIDSSHFYSVHDNDRIHDLLRSMTPENEKIHISGWFVSHGHDDHFCAFKSYLQFNMSDTVIDGIYMNLVSASHRDCRCWGESNIIMMESFRETVKESGITVYPLHTGQRFFIGEIEIEVLCTHEDVYPESLENFNDTSVVLMVKAEGNKILFPCDAGAQESRILEKRCADCLKCDIVQLSHHGHFGTTENFYRLADAKVVLCPNTRIKFDEEFHRYKANETAFEIAEEFYVSSEGTVKLTLPYKKGTAEVFPDETTENFEGIKQLWNYEYTDAFKEKHNAEFLKRSGRSL